MNILAVFAHPDDETMLAGGTLAALAACGHAVHVLLATRGEGGENGEPPLCSITDLGEVRSTEAACAAKTLGCQSLAFLNYVDPRIGPGDQLFPFEANFDTLASEICTAIRLNEIAAVITHAATASTVTRLTCCCIELLSAQFNLWVLTSPTCTQCRPRSAVIPSRAS